jgi:single-stranded-DNA-specific exonuclease
MVQSPGKVDLSQSIRYLEGIRARVEFSAFRGWALSASAHDMLANVNRPITPRVR